MEKQLAAEFKAMYDKNPNYSKRIGKLVSAQLAQDTRQDQMHNKLMVFPMTSYLGEADKQKYMNQGVDNFMEKPFSLEQLRRELYLMLTS